MRPMKLIFQITIFVFIMMTAGITWSQSQDSSKVDSTKAHTKTLAGKKKESAKDKKSDKEKKAARSDNSLTGFVDENGNGLDDRIEKNPGTGKKKWDRFIDRDGDGICDGKESAFGLKKAFRHRRGKGKR